MHCLFILMQVDDKVLVQEMKNESRKGGKLDLQLRGPYTIAEDLGKAGINWRMGMGKCWQEHTTAPQTQVVVGAKQKARLIQGWSTHTISCILAHKHTSSYLQLNINFQGETERQ